MATLIDALNYNNEVFRAFVYWSTIMCLKMLAMSILTALQRFKNKVGYLISLICLQLFNWILFQSFANPEDTATFKNLKPKFDDPDVERVRRAHRNDLENIIAFIIVAFFYVLTGPQAFIAVNLFRVGAISRIVHTFVYAIFPTQPARAISWFACYAVTGYMAIQVLFFFM